MGDLSTVDMTFALTLAKKKSYVEHEIALELKDDIDCYRFKNISYSKNTSLRNQVSWM